MSILQKRRVHFLLGFIGVVLLSITAEKCREMVGKEAASKSGEFTFLNCFDGSSGTVACLVKEGVKLYFYNIRAAHVEIARNKAIETALADALTQGMAAKEAAKLAKKDGEKAAKLATRKAKRIIGPIIAGGWDFFEALYFGGTLAEGFLRGSGTLVGTYSVGFVGEQRFGRFGYLVGSHLGSWIGGRIGLMVYDVVSGIHHLLQFGELVETKVSDDEVFESGNVVTSEVSDDSSVPESQTWNGGSDESNTYDASAGEYESFVDESSVSDESSNYETHAYETSYGREEF